MSNYLIKLCCIWDRGPITVMARSSTSYKSWRRVVCNPALWVFPVRNRAPLNYPALADQQSTAAVYHLSYPAGATCAFYGCLFQSTTSQAPSRALSAVFYLWSLFSAQLSAFLHLFQVYCVYNRLLQCCLLFYPGSRSTVPATKILLFIFIIFCADSWFISNKLVLLCTVNTCCEWCTAEFGADKLSWEPAFPTDLGQWKGLGPNPT